MTNTNQEGKMRTEIKETALSDCYDYIQRVFEKQNRVVEFNLIYGDGTTHKPLTLSEVKAVYDSMTEVLNDT